MGKGNGKGTGKKDENESFCAFDCHMAPELGPMISAANRKALILLGEKECEEGDLNPPRGLRKA